MVAIVFNRRFEITTLYEQLHEQLADDIARPDETGPHPLLPHKAQKDWISA
jgi:hypothetical protein